MLDERMKTLIREMPKGENHIHIEGSIPAKTALRLAKKNGITLPFTTEEGMTEYIKKNVVDLNSFMVCDRMINSVCIDEEDYYQVLYDLGKQAYDQNIIYQELHLDYPLNEVRGIPLDVVINGYEAGRKAVMRDFGVEIVFIAGIDRSLSSEQCVAFVRALEPYLDIIDGIGMDCEEKGNPCIKHVDSYRLAGEMGLFRTAHAGEDDGAYNIWDALLELGCQRIDHGLRAIDDPKLMDYLAENKILLAMCTRSNAFATHLTSLADHPIKRMMEHGIVCSISSDDPPYVGDLIQEYESVVEEIGFTEKDVIEVARNSLEYSIKGQHLLPRFDTWVANWLKEA
ncbi:MAG TPA: adenosine deaminase [Clostridiaceae bacterium]|nr:adenosine deaminase [Clostridiaceae bacterium]